MNINTCSDYIHIIELLFQVLLHIYVGDLNSTLSHILISIHFLLDSLLNPSTWNQISKSLTITAKTGNKPLFSFSSVIISIQTCFTSSDRSKKHCLQVTLESSLKIVLTESRKQTNSTLLYLVFSCFSQLRNIKYFEFTGFKISGSITNS